MQITNINVWSLLEKVYDPEIPVLTVVDLGVIRDVKLVDEKVEVVITPTYSGCPAMNVIEAGIRDVLSEAGFEDITVTTVLSPAWTTDWLSESGRKKLLDYGIAPPEKSSVNKQALFAKQQQIACPLCGSRDTEMVSQFGSTACKSLYKCRSCLEPFDYFKCH